MQPTYQPASPRVSPSRNSVLSLNIVGGAFSAALVVRYKVFVVKLFAGWNLIPEAKQELESCMPPVVHRQLQSRKVGCILFTALKFDLILLME